MIYSLEGMYFGRGRRTTIFKGSFFPMKPSSALFSGFIEDQFGKSNLINIKISDDKIFFSRNLFDELGYRREIEFKLYKNYNKKDGEFWEGEMIDKGIQNRVRCNIYTE